jgi:hypothetical protein
MTDGRSHCRAKRAIQGFSELAPFSLAAFPAAFCGFEFHIASGTVDRWPDPHMVRSRDCEQ